MSGDSAAITRLDAISHSWVDAAPALEHIASNSPLLQEASGHIADWPKLGSIGIEALQYLRSGNSPPAGWREKQLTVLREAVRPHELVDFVVLAPLEKLVSAASRPKTQQSSGPDSNRVTEIARMLTAQPSGFGVPCSDRPAWEAKADKLQEMIAEAEKALTTPLASFDEQAYLKYSETGDRMPMERNLHSRMDQLVPLVLAECAEYKGRFLPRIAEVMDSLAAQPSWTLSAHDPQLLNLHGVRYYVDLNAADMADNLAEALYLLGDKIPADTLKRVADGMEKHVFGPMRQSLRHDDSAQDHNGNWWLYADMNWNAVCLKGVTGAALAMLPNVDDRALFVAAAEHYIQHYDSGFQSDGYDTEGLGYWNYGFSHFVELRENLFRATNGKIDLLANSKMQKVALFGAEFPMTPDNAAAFGDAGVMPHADLHLMAVIDRIFQIPPVQPPLPVQSFGVQHAGLTSLALDLFPVPGDELPAPESLSHRDLQKYYADSGVLVSRAAPGQKLAVTIKAGGNTTHSHNDIGSFAIGLGDVQPVGDPGGPHYYTGATFGPHRLDFKLLNSFGHPVPEIGGQLQLDATKVHVTVVSHSLSSAEDSLTIDMSNAYQAPQLERVTRTLVHSRAGEGSVEITDDFGLTGPTEIIESLPTHGTWTMIDSHTLLFNLGGRRLRATIEAPVPATFTQTNVEEYGNSFTRVEVHIPLAASGRITMRFTPAE